MRLEHRRDLVLRRSTFAILCACGIALALSALSRCDRLHAKRIVHPPKSLHQPLLTVPTWLNTAEGMVTALTTPRKDGRLRWEGTEAVHDYTPRPLLAAEWNSPRSLDIQVVSPILQATSRFLAHGKERAFTAADLARPE